MDPPSSSLPSIHKTPRMNRFMFPMFYRMDIISIPALFLLVPQLQLRLQRLLPLQQTVQ
jgi:hypothetical protein